jgi:hypothetical protein
MKYDVYADLSIIYAYTQEEVVPFAKNMEINAFLIKRKFV